MMFLGLIPSLLYASNITKKAKVESRPPDIPITVFSILVWINLFINPLA